jgi:phosphoribosyl-ATP pyrophosphohydrolase/phosphoribosyl-AMP cyclohydrolase
LFNNRKKLLKKISEEAFEVVTFESKENLRWEIADLIYFVSTLAVAEGIEWQDIVNELGGRRKPEPVKFKLARE